MLVRSGSPGHRLWMPDPALRAVLDAVPSALALVDRHGVLVHCNAAWMALGSRTAVFGDLGSLVTQADHVGTPYLRRLAGLEGPLALPAHRLARAAQEALAGRPHEPRTAYRMRRPDGEEPFEAVLSLLPQAPGAADDGEPARGPGKAGGSAGPLLVLQHLETGDRERAAAAEALALEKGLEAEDLRARERRLARRMATLVRQLHAPVTPVRLELHLLARESLGPLTPAQARALAVASRNVDRLAEGQDLFPALLQAGPALPEDFDLGATVAEATEERQTEALQAGVRLIGPSAPAHLPIRAVPGDVRDALDRFLDHALEASPAGGTVAVEAQERDGRALAAVVDSGPGLSGRDLRTVFEPWGGRRGAEQDRRGRDRDLGLHFARVEVERSGGQAWAESDGAGQGLLLGMAFPLLGHGGFPQASGEGGRGAARPT